MEHGGVLLYLRLAQHAVGSVTLVLTQTITTFQRQNVTNTRCDVHLLPKATCFSCFLINVINL